MMPEYQEQGNMEVHMPLIYAITRSIKPKVILEIGVSTSAKSTLAISHALYDGKLKAKHHGCDINPNSAKLSSLPYPLKMHIKTSDQLAKKWTKPIDLLFIDGCHEYSQVKKDYLNFSRYLTVNGFMFFHDTYPPSEALKAPTKCHNAYLIIEDLRKDKKIEFLTLPYSYGLTVCRKIK